MAPRLLFAAAALALALHAWVGRWSLIGTNVVLPLGATIWLVLYFWGWGVLVGRLRPFRPAERELDPLLAFAVGLCTSVVVVLLLGFAGVLRPAVFLALSAVVVACGLWKRPPWRAWSARPRGVECESAVSTRIRVALLTFVGVWILFALILAFIPERSWDAQAYHLAMGKIYLSHGRILSIPWMFHSNFPICADLVFLHGLLLGNDQSAVLLALVLALVAAAAVHRLASVYLSSTASVAVLLAFVLSPDVAESVDACLVEITWTAFAILSLACALEWARGDRKLDHRLNLAAIFAGFAAGTKLPGLGSALAVCVVVLLAARKAAPAARFAWLSALAASPCYLKSWFHTGTPIWPLSLGVFRVRSWSDDAQLRFLEFSRAEWAPLSRASFETAFATLRRIILDRNEITLCLLVLLVAGSILLAVDSRGRRGLREVAPLAVFILPHVLFWCFVSQQSRFLLPALPAVVVAMLYLSRSSADDASPLTRVSATVICAALFIAPLPAWIPKVTAFVRSGLPIVRGMNAREEVFAQSPYHRLCAAANGLAPPGSRILLFQEIRGYALDHEYMWGDPINQAVLDYANIADAEALRARLAVLGITHVLVGPYRQSDRYADFHLMSMIEDVLSTSRRIATEQGFELYDLGQPSNEERPRLAASSRASDDFPAQGAMDGRADPQAWDQRGGWMSGRSPTRATPEELLLLYPQARSFHRIRLVSYPDARQCVQSFAWQYERDGAWIDIPGARVDSAIGIPEWKVEFAPITARRLRLLVSAAGGGAARVMEVTLD